MSDYIIATSSTSDLPRTWLEEHNIPFIAYSYTVNDEPREDDCREETRAAVYAGMRRGDKLHTSMINEFVYYDFLKTFLDEGKDVIFLDMSQKMSVSFVNANKAADKLRAEFPERKLYVMDTLCISGGLGLLVMNMVRRKEAGAGFDEVVAWGEENKLRIAHRFTVDDLEYREGGASRTARRSSARSLTLSPCSMSRTPVRSTWRRRCAGARRRCAPFATASCTISASAIRPARRSTSCRRTALPMPSGCATRSARHIPRSARSRSRRSASSSARTAAPAC